MTPSAVAVAERANVGMRTVFRHFEDMDALFAAVDESIRDRTEARFVGGDRDGSLVERIRHAVERHADGYESQRQIVLSTSAMLWRSEVLRKNYARYQRGLRKDLDDWLPELQRLSTSEREAVDAVASFEMWHRLRYHQGLSRGAAIQVVTELLEGLLLQ